MTDQRLVPVLFLDLDGTVREAPPGRYVHGPEDVRVFPAALDNMRAWKDQGGRIVGVTNQGGVALGYTTEAKVLAAVTETQRQCDGLFDTFEWCIHHPDAVDPEQRDCWCRKPRPGMLVRAVIQLGYRYHDECYPPGMSLMVGDMDSDRIAAAALGIRFQWATHWLDRRPVPAALRSDVPCLDTPPPAFTGLGVFPAPPPPDHVP